MFEAYKIGVKISVINHASIGLMALSKDFLKTEADAAKLEARILSIKNQALKGGLMVALGAAGLSLLKGPYEEAKKLAQAQANFQTLNLSAAENGEAYSKAALMSHQILGTTITGNVKGIHDLHTAFGDLHHAIKSAPDFAKYSVAASIANGGKEVEGLVYNSVKALEHRGGKVINNDASFKNELDLQSRVQFGSKGKVSGSDFFHASQTGKMAYTLFDKEYLYGQFAAYMQAKSGATAGTAAMTAFSSLVGGHMDKKAKGFLSDIGLYQEGFSKKRLDIMNNALKGLSPEQRKTAIASMGGESVIAGGLKDGFAELYSKRPDIFIREYLAPAIRKRFGMDLSDEQVGLIIAKSFNRNTSDFLGEHIINKSKFEKDAAIFERSMGFGQAYEHYLKTPEGAEQAASSAWKNFLTVFGSVYLPVITNGLTKLAGALNSMGGFVERNQTLVKGLVYAFAALSGGLLIRGSVLLLTAAFRVLGGALLMQAVGGAAGIRVLAMSFMRLAGPIGLVTGVLGGMYAAVKWFESTEFAKRQTSATDKIKLDSLNRQIASYGPNADPSKDVRLRGLIQQRDAFIKTTNDKPVQVQTSINLDGRKVAEVVSKHQSRELNRPATGGSHFDPTIGVPPVGMNYVK